MTQEFLKSTLMKCSQISVSTKNVFFDGKYFTFNGIIHSTTVNYVIDKNIMIYCCNYIGNNIAFSYDFNNNEFYAHKKNQIENISFKGLFPTNEEEYFQYSTLYNLPFDLNDALSILDFFTRLKAFAWQQ